MFFNKFFSTHARCAFILSDLNSSQAHPDEIRGGANDVQFLNNRVESTSKQFPHISNGLGCGVRVEES